MTTMLNSRRQGFAMPMVILVMGFLTATVLAAFARSEADIKTADNQGAQTIAFALAEAGLADFVAAGSLPTAGTASATYDYDAGQAIVEAARVRNAIGDEGEMWLVRSTGVGKSAGTRPSARRTVAQFAEFVPGKMDVDAAWTSLSGLTKNGASGTISGYDHAPSPKCSSGDVAGISTPTKVGGKDGYNQNGGSFVPEGDPDWKKNGTPAQMADSVKIDWDGIINHNAMAGAITHTVVGGNGFPTKNYFAETPKKWPVIYVKNGTGGSFALPYSGQGTLIVEGSLTINGSDRWDGIILAGAHVTSNGNNTVMGTAISGLNIKLGLSVPVNAIGNGTKTFAYHSCNIMEALKGLSSVRPLQNAWMDNWAAW